MASLINLSMELEISPLSQETANHEVDATTYSYPAARDLAYINTLCLNALYAWLQEEPDLPGTPRIWLEASDRPAIWEYVNGSLITVGDTRLAIIPSVVLSEADHPAELRVEQEWVDIPDWAAHYYLMVQVNPEDGWLRLLGYATHPQLKQTARYDALDRTYSLSTEQLIQEMSVLWTARELSPNWSPAVTPLPSLTIVQIDALIQRLSQPPYSPRLEIPFEQWAAFITDSTRRQQLYQQRLNVALNNITQHTPGAVPARINLSRWVESLTEAGWQVVRDLNLLSGTSLSMATARSGMPSEPQPPDQPYWKTFELGGYEVMLLIAREAEVSAKNSSEQAGEINIAIAAKTRSSTPLPHDLQIQVSFTDENGNVDRLDQKILANQPDQVVEVPLLGTPGEPFSITLRLGEHGRTEHFQV